MSEIELVEVRERVHTGKRIWIFEKDFGDRLLRIEIGFIPLPSIDNEMLARREAEERFARLEMKYRS